MLKLNKEIVDELVSEAQGKWAVKNNKVNTNSINKSAKQID